MAGEQVEAEGSAEEFGPGEAASRGGGRWRLSRSGGVGGWGCGRGRNWDDPGAQPGVGSEHPVEPGEIEPGRRDEGGEFAEELERGEEEVGGAVGAGPLHPIGEGAVLAPGESLEREGTASSVAAKSLQSEPVILMDPGIGMEAESFEGGAAASASWWVR